MGEAKKKTKSRPRSLARVAGFWGAAYVVGVAITVAAIKLGHLKIPLPAPAKGHYVHVIPAADKDFPWKPRALEGILSPNSKLQQATQLFKGKIEGSESVGVSPDGHLVMLDKYNKVWEAVPTADGGYALGDAPVADLGAGRPLGYHFDKAGDLIVCDSFKGLIKWERSGSGRVEVLTSRVSDSSPIDPGTPIIYTNDLDIGSDGTVYFTSCTDVQPQRNEAGFWDTYKAYVMDLAQGAPKGRLLSYSPATGETRVLATGLHYANGVALAPDGSYVMVVETNRIKVHRHWLKGPKAGQTEVVINRLPGLPDGITRASDGNFWVALITPVPPVAKWLREPGVRGVMAWLPDHMRPKMKPWGAVIKISPEGQILDFLHDPDGSKVAYISAVSEAGGKLFIGNLVQDYVGVLDLAAVGSAVGDVPTSSHH